MNLLLAALAVAATTAIAVVVMLLVRRRAPEGSYFADGDRAAGVFGVLATGFSVLLGFIVFLSFESYDRSRVGAEAEAVVLAQQVETAQLLPRPAANELIGQLVCYGRSVVFSEWPQAESGKQGDEINPWGAELFRTLERVDPTTPSQQAAYSKWLDQRFERDAARIDRIHGAAGIIPDPLWVVLLFISVVIFVFMLFFADSGERVITQAVLMGSVVSVIASMLLLIQFLNSPFHTGVGGLRPVAMERALSIIDQELRPEDRRRPLPCDAEGNAVS